MVNVQLPLKSKIPIRFWIACMVFLTTFTCYTTRVNLSVSIVSMTKGKTKGIPYCKLKEGTGNGGNESHELPDYGTRYDWNERIQGSLLGAYFYGYILTNLLAGLTAEYFGPLKVILLVHAVAAVMNTVSVFAAGWHWGVLFFCRLVLGMGGALVYPSLQILIAFWAPPQEKGKFVSALMGNVLGTCVTWPVVGLVTTYLGWHWGFYVVSLVNVLFCIVFFLVVTDTPETHRWISPEEVAYIKESQQGTVVKKKVVAPYKDIFKNFPYWMLMICHFGNEWGLYLQLTLIPKFISDVIGFDLSQAGGLSALPPLMRMTFGLVLGYIADELLRREIFSKRVVRKSYTVVSHVIPGILLLIISFIGCSWIPIIILLTLSLGFNGACVQNTLINPQDLAPNFSGTIYAINSFFAGMTGFIVPTLNGEFTKNENGITQWSYTFIIGGAVYCASGAIWIVFGSVEEQAFNRKGQPTATTTETTT
ncbi:sialin-like isoform X2 [Diabrotica virgifera virgifera]|uniref:Major facilitator superfamily (MFS) profile domain-containing protein n=1 Tax=Diabrotica virgifera virgifera TaxID=50390 RepID=A0ABM5IZX1_DIAVI|nr:sialin-like isoform X2 [Diabrotica virgifera virgifera]